MGILAFVRLALTPQHRPGRSRRGRFEVVFRSNLAEFGFYDVRAGVQLPLHEPQFDQKARLDQIGFVKYDGTRALQVGLGS